ncbi:MAG: ATP-binding protein, partial [Halobacteriales archaeon]|nr:ATP-binding protein [Halobacteriales archaeon]
MNGGAIDVIELLLTARHYTDDRTLDENDLPPRIRSAYWADGEIERPLSVTEEDATTATGIEEPWAEVSDLMFTQRDDFTGVLSLSQPDLAEEWFLSRAEAERVNSNPTLASVFEGSDAVDFEIDYDLAREQNRPIQADRAWIDGLLAEYFDEDDEEMLDLVEVKAPEEIEMTLEDLVLTGDQEEEIQKIGKAIEHRDYLAAIG